MPTPFDRHHPSYPPVLGARLLPEGGVEFRVWAPKAERVELEVESPLVERLPMVRDARGYSSLRHSEAQAGWRYRYRLNEAQSFPDPVSRSQPDGVHQASEVTELEFHWSDADWSGRTLNELVIYELHVGTFSPEGTFDGVVKRLDRLQALGINAIELMPVAQFPGDRNWGYDGVYPFAVQSSYGGARGLQQLVDACHARGIAVLLDVVFNHLGPEGNYLGQFGHYFSSRYRTPWGDALNFDGRHSDDVRRYFIENALSWFCDFHIDGLRLDAVHAIFDQSARPFLRELADLTRELGELQNRRLLLIAESNLNDPKLVQSSAVGGFGLDAQWVDDFHHALHMTLTGERSGYYTDYRGLEDLLVALRRGFIFAGQESHYRGRKHGSKLPALEARQVVVSIQNHDQIGNRAIGDRLTAKLSFEQLKLAAGFVLLSPYVPMLFMGEEYGETAPFAYFVSHSDEKLIRAVRDGRRRDFAHFKWDVEPPDAQSEATFKQCVLGFERHVPETLSRGQCVEGCLPVAPSSILWMFYQVLIRLRRSHPTLQLRSLEFVEVLDWSDRGGCGLHYRVAEAELLVAFNTADREIEIELPAVSSGWKRLLSSRAKEWGGTEKDSEEDHLFLAESIRLAPHSFVVFECRTSEF